MSGGEPSSIKQDLPGAVRVPVLSWLSELRVYDPVNNRCAVLPSVARGKLLVKSFPLDPFQNF